jgi:hypothetical protein
MASHAPGYAHERSNCGADLPLFRLVAFWLQITRLTLLLPPGREEALE